MQLKTFKYRLYATPAQEKRLEWCLNAARNWYNMCIAERKYSYELEGRSVGLYEQLRLVKRYKAAFRQFKDVHSHISQVATADCDKAFKAFFRRFKAKETPGYPRFKGYWHFDSFGYKEYGNGFKLDGKRLKLSGVGRVAVRWHRGIKATNAGRELVFVNPAYTSKGCSTCGHEFENFSLSVRWVNCRICGLSIDRDHNAAINILNRARNGWDASVGRNVEASSSCVP